MKSYSNKILFLTVFFSLMGLISAVPAKADSYFNAWFDILNDPTFGYHQAQYAPSTLKLYAFSYSYTDKSDTHFKVDCDSNGTYELDRIVSFYPWDMWNGGGGYFTDGGDYWRYNNPRSDKPAYWAFIRDNSLKCYYPLPGDYTITMVAERGGITAVSSRSFNLREPAVETQARPFYDNNIIGNVTGGYGAVWEGKMPKAPADIDFGVAIYNPITYSGTNSHWPLFTSSATLKFDCDSDGKYDATEGYSTTTNIPFYGRQWELWCASGGNFNIPNMWSSCLNPISASTNWYSKVCHYDKPGMYQALIRAELPTGAEPYVRNTSVNVPVLPSSSDATIDFSTGSDPAFGEAPRNGVDLEVNVSGVTWAHATYSFDCGNGQTANYSINSTYPKDFIQNYSYNLKDFCNYATPGEYTAKANLEFRAAKFPGGIDNVLSPSALFTQTATSPNFTTYQAKKELKIIATGKISGGTTGGTTGGTGAAMDEYIMVSPFNLKWDVDMASSCTVTQKEGIYSKTVSPKGPPIEGFNMAPGTYFYELTCVNASGKSANRTIKITVVK